MARLYAGTSGFAYDAWKPDFYPAGLPAKRFLAHYATRLNAVEINYTFRRLPPASTLQGWVEQTPPGFVFCLKAHQRITHIQRLQTGEFTDIFFRAIDPLRVVGRLGPVLFQLPPNMKCDPRRLEAFLAVIPDDVRAAFEFRHASWHTDEIFGLLRNRGVALCLAESDKLETPKVLTGGFVYSRLRKSEYSAAGRADAAREVRRLLDGGRDCYVFFKHEESPAGALYAEELLKSTG